MTILVKLNEARGAVLDDAHVGHIHGAFGTILHGHVTPRETWKHGRNEAAPYRRFGAPKPLP